MLCTDIINQFYFSCKLLDKLPLMQELKGDDEVKDEDQTEVVLKT